MWLARPLRGGGSEWDLRSRMCSGKLPAGFGSVFLFLFPPCRRLVSLPPLDLSILLAPLRSLAILLYLFPWRGVCLPESIPFKRTYVHAHQRSRWGL